MPKLRDVCRHIRSKNAGPFWVTVDLFFKDDEAYRRYGKDPALSPELFERLYGSKPGEVKFFHVDSLNTVKISYPRTHPQGWRGERDMHSGQQCYPLLDVEVGQSNW
jgi:hypothetical protein